MCSTAHTLVIALSNNDCYGTDTIFTTYCWQLNKTYMVPMKYNFNTDMYFLYIFYTEIKMVFIYNRKIFYFFQWYISKQNMQLMLDLWSGNKQVVYQNACFTLIHFLEPMRKHEKYKCLMSKLLSSQKCCIGSSIFSNNAYLLQ